MFYIICTYYKLNIEVYTIYLVFILQVAPKTFIPALFGHATEDIFIQPHHSDSIFNLYAVLTYLDIFCIIWYY